MRKTTAQDHVVDVLQRASQMDDNACNAFLWEQFKTNPTAELLPHLRFLRSSSYDPFPATPEGMEQLKRWKHLISKENAEKAAKFICQMEILHSDGRIMKPRNLNCERMFEAEDTEIAFHGSSWRKTGKEWKEVTLDEGSSSGVMKQLHGGFFFKSIRFYPFLQHPDCKALLSKRFVDTVHNTAKNDSLGL